MQVGDFTYRINGCAMTVHQKLGRGFMEYVYCRALAIELRRAGISFEREVWLPIYYDNYKIAARRVDFLCDNHVTIEVKAKTALEEKDFAQALNTLGRLNIERDCYTILAQKVWNSNTYSIQTMKKTNSSSR
jgi:GxxExxY protein